MLDKLKNIFIGASWIPSWIGYALGFLTELDVYLKNDGMPTTGRGWLEAMVGVLIAMFGRFVKQSNVSHAPDAKKTPVEVEPPKAGVTS